MSTESAARSPVRRWEYSLGNVPAYTGFEMFDGTESWFRVDEGPGYHVAANTATVLEVMQDTERFSSRTVVPIEPNPEYLWIPLMLDPPNHTMWRRWLAPFFTPKQIQKLSGALRRRCADLVDAIADRGEAEIVNDFARRFPTSVFLELFGLPIGDLDRLLAWETLMTHASNETDPDRSKMMQAMQEVMGYFGELIERRRAQPADPADDILSAALSWEIDGKLVPDDQMLSFCLLMLIAGLGTVASETTYMLHHLATHPADRARINADPEVRAVAVEEFLRAFPIIATGRKSTMDTEIAGCPIAAGDTILVPLAAAGRDATEYADPSRIDFDRPALRHLTFGAGPHRCLGSHLAREELRIVLDEWHRRIPDYSVADGAAITEHHAGTWGLDRLPLVWEV